MPILQEDAPVTTKVIPAAKKQATPATGLKKQEESSDTSDSESDSDEDKVSLRLWCNTPLKDDIL